MLIVGSVVEEEQINEHELGFGTKEQSDQQL